MKVNQSKFYVAATKDEDGNFPVIWKDWEEGCDFEGLLRVGTPQELKAYLEQKHPPVSQIFAETHSRDHLGYDAVEIETEYKSRRPLRYFAVVTSILFVPYKA